MNCRVCDSTSLELVIDLGMQPWCGDFLTLERVGKEPFYPLQVVLCSACRTAQLNHTVPKEIMFGDHTYLSGTTRSLSEHFRSVALEVDRLFLSGVQDKSVLDIGSNDGTQLRHYAALDYSVLGVEPSKTVAKIANDAGVSTVNEFFNLDVARRLQRKFHVINAAGVFFHLEELHSVTDGIREALRDDGVFIVQFLYMKRIIENLAFDQIYHEHLLYYTLHTIQALLSRHGLELFDAYVAPIHGGEVIGFVTHRGRREPTQRLLALQRAEIEDRCNELETYAAFVERIRQMKIDNLAYLGEAKRQGRRVFGFGAPAKGNTLLNHFGIGTQYLDCLVEKNELRRGLYSPGMHVPILIEKELSGPPDTYYVLAWNFKKEILANNQDLIKHGVEFYFPVNPRGEE